MALQVDEDMKVNAPQTQHFDEECGTDYRKEESGTVSKTITRLTTLKVRRCVMCY